MKVADFGNGPAPGLLEYRPAEVPHGTIETNRTCDLGCRLCYNLDRSSIKPAAQVKAEVDLLLRKRRLQAVSLLGGEPTLHPDLPEIIAHVKSRGIHCQILTNGRRLASDPDGGYLDRLVRAGLDRVLVHMDSGQGLDPDELEAAREMIFSRLEARKVHFCLSVTIYGSDRGRLAEAIRRYSRFRYFGGILATLALEPLTPANPEVRLEDEFAGLRRGLGIVPTAFVPSNQSRDDVNWLVYLYFADPEGGNPMALSAELNGILGRARRVLWGRESFLVIFPPVLVRPILALTAAAECVLHPGQAVRILRAALGTLWRGARFHYILIQAPPELDEKTGAMRICRHCPDATIRNGRLTPVCIADRMSPLPGHKLILKGDIRWVPAVYAHLQDGTA